MTNMNRSDITAQIGQNLRRARKRKYLTQQDISDRTGISRTTIGKYETGDVEIGVTNLFAVCEAIGCDPRDVLGEPIK